MSAASLVTTVGSGLRQAKVFGRGYFSHSQNEAFEALGLLERRNTVIAFLGSRPAAGRQPKFFDTVAGLCTPATIMIDDGRSDRLGALNGLSRAVIAQAFGEEDVFPLVGIVPAYIKPGFDGARPHFDNFHTHFIRVATGQTGDGKKRPNKHLQYAAWFDTALQYLKERGFTVGIILSNGGELTEKRVIFHLNNQTPVCVLGGTGGLADRIYNLLKGLNPAERWPDEVEKRMDLLFPVHVSQWRLAGPAFRHFAAAH